MITAGLLLVGFILISYAYISYKKAEHSLQSLKSEDLVSYYLELALHLLPRPFWSAILGALMLISALIILLIKFLKDLPVFA